MAISILFDSSTPYVDSFYVGFMAISIHLDSFYGDLDSFYGDLDSFYGDLDSFYVGFMWFLHRDESFYA